MLDQMTQTLRRCKPVRFSNVTLKIDKQLLIQNFTCQLDNAGKTVVIGPNGAGKSLFLRLMARMIEPTSGQISAKSEELGGINNIDQSNQCLSLVFQSPVLLRRSVYENVAFVLRQKNLSKGSIHERVFEALKQAGLQSFAQTPARAMSGGEQQRLALARALVVDPVALLLDEPTTSLDPASTYIVEQMIEKADRNGTKIVFVTHDIRQAKRLADDILFIHDGQVLIHKPAKAFFKDPGHHAAQAYLDGRVPDV